MQVYRGGLDVVVNILVLHGMNRPGVNESVRENFEQLFNDAQLTYHLAFLEGDTQTLKQVVELLISKGIKHFNIIPILLFPAKHYFEDIPNILKDIKRNYPPMNYIIAEPLGTHQTISNIVKNKIANTLIKNDKVQTVVLLAHGSSTYTEPRQAVQHLAESCDVFGIPIQTVLLYGAGNYVEHLEKILKQYPQTLIVPLFLRDGYLVQRTKQNIRQQAFAENVTFASAINFVPDLAKVIKDRINELEVLANVCYAS